MCENVTETILLKGEDCPLIICPECKSNEVEPLKTLGIYQTTRTTWQCQNCKTVFI